MKSSPTEKQILEDNKRPLLSNSSTKTHFKDINVKHLPFSQPKALKFNQSQSETVKEDSSHSNHTITPDNKGKCKAMTMSCRFGKIRYSNGDIYTGSILNRTRDGYGTLKTSNIIYTGTWKKNIKNGDFLVLRLDNGLAEKIFYHNDILKKSEIISKLATHSTQNFKKNDIVCQKLAELKKIIRANNIIILKKRSEASFIGKF